MESIQEFIPFAKEMLSQKPSRGMLKVYLVGSLFAVLGTVIGLVETVCHPFSSGEPMDAEMLLMMAQEERTVQIKTNHSVGVQEEKVVVVVEEEEEEKKEEEEEEKKKLATTQSMTLSKPVRLSQRSMANRLHAS
ncbi:hypothetical protein PAMA_011120 [Pampus argenteus]